MPKQGTVTACDHMNLWAHFSIQPKWIQVSAGEYFLYLRNSSGNSSIFMRHNSCFTAKGCLKKIAVNPIPAHELIPGEVFSQVPPQLSLAAAEPQKT